MQQLKLLLSQFWRSLVIALIIAVLTFALLFGHLGKQPPLLSGGEVATRSASQSLKHIFSNPVNAPLTVPEHLFIKLRPHSVAATRATGALYGVLVLILFFGILRFWQDNLTAVLGTALFGTSSWFLHTTRLATPDVLLFAILVLVAAGLWLKHTLRRNAVVFVCAIVAAMALYIPGFIWFIIAGIVWQRRTLKHELQHTKNWSKISATILFLVLALPFILAAIHMPTLLRSSAGLPLNWQSPLQLLKTIYHIPISLFIHAPINPAHWLGNVSILDIFEDGMFILGIYIFWSHRDLDRSRLLLGLCVLSIALITIGGAVNITVLMPLVYFVIAAGIFYLLELWFKVFPRNPVARYAGMIIVIAAIVVSCNYHLREYFIAWPHAPATHAVFTQPAAII